MNDSLRMEIIESFEYFDDVARDQRFGEFAKMLQRLLQRSILDESFHFRQPSSREMQRRDALENDVDKVVCPNESFVLDDARMGKILEQFDLVREL